MKLLLCQVSTRSFDFTAVYPLQGQSAEAMRVQVRKDFTKAWRRHCKQYEVPFDAYFLAGLLPDICMIEIPAGVWLRDREVI